LQRLVKIFLSTVLLVIPLFFLKDFQSTFAHSKEILFKLLILLFLLSLSLIFAKRQQISFNSFLKNKIFLGLLSFLTIYILVTIFSVTPIPAYYGSSMRGFGLLTLLYLSIWYLLCVCLLDKKDYRIYLLMISVGSFLVGGYAILQKFGLEIFFKNHNLDIFVGRSFSTLGNPSYLGQFMSITFFTNSYLLFTEDVFKKKIYFGISSLVTLFALFASESRAAILALVIGLVLVCLKFLNLKRLKQNKKTVLIVLLALVATSALGLTLVDLSRFQINSFALRSLDSRFNLWNSALQLITENPFGHGLETFRIYFQETLHSDFFLLEENLNSFADRIHNETLGVLFTGGIVALLAYIYLIIQIFKVYFKSKDKLKLLIAITIIVNIVQNQFSFIDFSSSIILLFLLAILSIDREKKHNIHLKSKSKVYLIALVIVLFIAKSFYSHIYEPTQFQRYYRFYNVFKPISYDNSVLSLKTSISYFPYYSKPWFDLMILDASSMPRSLHFLKQIDVGSPEVIAWEANYYSVIDIDKSVMLFEELIKVNPKNPHWIRAYGDALYKNDLLDDALVQYQKYLELVPEFWKWRDEIDSKTKEQQRQYRIFFKNVPDFWNTVNRVEEIQSMSSP
jgi:O-antigen ligase